MNVTLSRTPAVSLMLTYSLTVSLGTSLGKAVRPWLLQSTVLLLHTHLSGQPEANEPKEPTITRLPRSPVSRLMLATSHSKVWVSLVFRHRTLVSLCLTANQWLPCHTWWFLSTCFPAGAASSLLAGPPPTAGNCRAGPPDGRIEGRTGPRPNPPISAKIFTCSLGVGQVEDTFENAQCEMQPV